MTNSNVSRRQRILLQEVVREGLPYCFYEDSTTGAELRRVAESFQLSVSDLDQEIRNWLEQQLEQALAEWSLKSLAGAMAGIWGSAVTELYLLPAELVLPLSDDRLTRDEPEFQFIVVSEVYVIYHIAAMCDMHAPLSSLTSASLWNEYREHEVALLDYLKNTLRRRSLAELKEIKYALFRLSI